MEERRRKLLRIFAMIVSVFFLFSCSDVITDYPRPPGGNEEPEPEVTKMTWWNDARFGMFIHYGVYAGLQGEYIGKDVTGKSIHFQTVGNNNTKNDTIKYGSGAGAEWIFYEASIPREEYRKYAPLFTADKYDPKAIVNLAKRVGMKYIVLTAKHHDGFCLWESGATEWNISKTPAGEKWNNDLIAPLAAAAREAGLKFGLYFSHARDWMHEGALGPIPELGKGSYSYAENQKYMTDYTYPMISELLSRYQPDIFWWDSPECNPYEEFALRCSSMVDNYNPEIIQNDRVSTLSAYQGDHSTPEQSIREDKVDGDTELCMTMNSTWGYSEFDDRWKVPQNILYSLLRTNKMGGNLLLNIGPKADGSIPKKSIEYLEKVGEWMDENETGVHGTRRSPFQYNMPYGPTTWRKIDGVNHLFYHVFYWDGSGELWIPGVMNTVDEVTVSIPSAPQLDFYVESVNGIGLRVSGLPQQAPSDLCTMLDIQFNVEPEFEEGIREINGTIHLDALATRLSGGEISDWDKRPCYNWYTGSLLDYKLVVVRGGTYNISAQLAAFFTGILTFEFSDGSTLQGRNTVTPSGHANFEWQDMGDIYLEPGVYTLVVTSLQANSWLKLREIRLQHR